MKLQGLVLLCALLAGCASDSPREEALPAPPPAPIFDNLMVPGQRIGPVAIGMTGAQLLQALGSPVKSNHLFQDVAFITFSNGIAVTVRDRDNRVTQMQTTESRYQTKEGVGVGHSEFEVRTRLGPPVRARNDQAFRVLCYYGMTVMVDLSSGRVTQIGIWSASSHC